MYKQAIAKLQEVMSKKYPEFRAKFYINRKNINSYWNGPMFI